MAKKPISKYIIEIKSKEQAERISKTGLEPYKVEKSKTGITTVEYRNANTEQIKVLEGVRKENEKQNKSKSDTTSSQNRVIADTQRKLEKHYKHLTKLQRTTYIEGGVNSENLNKALSVLKSAETKAGAEKQTQKRISFLTNAINNNSKYLSQIKFNGDEKQQERMNQALNRILKRGITKPSEMAVAEDVVGQIDAIKNKEKEEKKRINAIEKLRKANHKKQVTRYKTRSAFSRNLSTMSLSLNMSMLGIMFSFMSLFSMLTGVFGSIFAAASNLTGAVSGGALAEAFLSPEALGMTAINPETGKEEAIGLKRQGMDVGSLVESYKKSLGVQGEMAYQMSRLSAALLNNPEFMAGVMSAIDELSNTFSDPEFVRSVVKSMKTIMEMLPDVLDSLLILLDLTTMFIPFLQTWLPLILASVILLPVLSLFNAVFGVVAMGFAVTNDLLAAILVSQEATRLASIATSGASALGVPAAAAGGGILASLGLGGAGAGLGTISLYGIALLATTIISTKIKNWISDSFNDIVFETPIISVPFDMLEDITDGLIDKAKEIVLNWIVGSDGSEEKRDILSSVLDYIGDWVDDLFSPSILLNDASISGFSGLNAQLITMIWDFAVEVLNNILTTGDPLSSFRAPPSLADRGYATGGYVSNTGLAMVHEGEYISNSSEPTSNGNVSQNVNITVYGDLDSKAADKVIDELVAQQRYSSWS